MKTRLKRIAIVLDFRPWSGGIHQYSESLLEAIIELGVDRYLVDVLCVGGDWKGVITQRANQRVLYFSKLSRCFSNLLHFTAVPKGVSRWLSAKLSPVCRHIVGNSYDFVFFPGQDVLSYQCPCIALTSIHDLMHRYEPTFPEVSSLFRYTLRERRFRGIVTHSHAVFADSELGAIQICESYGLDRSRVHILRYTPSISRSPPSCDAENSLRLNLPDNFLFYPAQFWKHKNHESLIIALYLLRKEGVPAVLVFTGAKKYEYKRLLSLVSRYCLEESVKFMSHIPKDSMGYVYSRAKGLIMPTFFGPTNIPPLEAMVFGCPVAVSDIYASREVYGDAALYFNPRCVLEIVSCMRRIWSDSQLCTDLRERGFRKVESFSKSAFRQSLACSIDTMFSDKALFGTSFVD